MAQHSHFKGEPSVLEALDGELMCGVCLQPYERPLLLPCGHNFCTKCINGIINTGSDRFDFAFVSVGPPNSFTCPICQANINLRKHSIDNLPVNKALENVVFIYKNHNPTDIFDYAWNTDMKTERSRCVKHELVYDEYCVSCSELVCRKCKEDGHDDNKRARHKVRSVQHTVAEHQSKIAGLLTEVKKKNILLNDRIRLLEDVLSGIERNEEKVVTQLDHQISSIISIVRQQQEELKRILANDLNEIQVPISEELKKCKSLKTTMQELMKKLANVRQTRDVGLRIQLMKDSGQYLEKLLYYEIPWCVENQEIPEVAMPTWELHNEPVLESIKQLYWTHLERGRPKQQPNLVQPVQDTNEDQSQSSNLGETESGSKSDTVHVPRNETSIVNEMSHETGDITQSQAAAFDEPDGDIPTLSSNGATNTHGISVKSSEASGYVKEEGQVNTRSSNRNKNGNIHENQANEDQTGSHVSHHKTFKPEPKGTSLLNENVTGSSVMNLDISSPEVAEKFLKRGERKTNHLESPTKDSGTRKMNDDTKKKEKEKRKKVRKSGEELFKDVDTSPTTTSEALASFVARRRTISPATSVSRNLDTWSTSHDGPRKSDTIRQSLSDTKLLSPNLKPVQFDTKVMELDSSPSVKPTNASGHANRKAKSSVGLAMPTRSSMQEKTVNEQLSPKSFLKQPISVNLDFDMDSTPKRSMNVKGQETQI